MMRVACTGQSGLGKANFLEEVQRIASDAGHEVATYDIGSRMCQEAGVPESAILNLRLPHLTCLRRSVMKDVLRDVRGQEHAILCTHAVFRWENGLFLALTPEDIKAFEPDMFVVLIDDVEALKGEFDARRAEEPERPEITLLEILAWREEEIVTTQLCALLASNERRVPFYVLPQMHQVQYYDRHVEFSSNASIFFQLMFHSDKKKVYPSFPITQIQESEELVNQTIEFRERLRQHLIVFDPYDIREGYLHAEYAGLKASDPDAHTLVLEVRDMQVRLPMAEIPFALTAIDDQIRSRDARLIDQSDFLLAFLPTDPKTKAPAA
ncbi:MAG: hypothetical protein MUP04_09840, partial [Anaerolineae bacterium]|nr:hypothetical protein [Anaerolineae bacterium]